MLTFSRYVALGVLCVGVSACSLFERPGPSPSSPATLTRQLNMIGADGRLYGTVEFDPIKGGKVFDSQGRILGTIVPVPQ